MKIKIYEKKFMRIVHQPDNQTPQKAAFNEALNFWQSYDKLFGTNHAEIMTALYGRPSSVDKTLTNVAIKVCVSERTLIRYRKMYMKSFQIFSPSGDFVDE